MCKKLRTQKHWTPPALRINGIRSNKIYTFPLDFPETTPWKCYHSVYVYLGGLQVRELQCDLSMMLLPLLTKNAQVATKKPRSSQIYRRQKSELLLTWTLKMTWLFSNQFNWFITFTSVRKSHFWGVLHISDLTNTIMWELYILKSSQYACRYYSCVG